MPTGGRHSIPDIIESSLLTPSEDLDDTPEPPGPITHREAPSRCIEPCDRLVAVERAFGVLSRLVGRLPTLTDAGEGLALAVDSMNKKLDKLLEVQAASEARVAPVSRVAWLAIATLVGVMVAGAAHWIVTLHH